MIKDLKRLNSDFGGALEKLCELSCSRGCRIYLVGGVVRDLLLGKRIFDLDILVEGDAISFAQVFAQKNAKHFKKHHAFGTATVYFGSHHIDFVTARKETYKHWGALPKVEPATLTQDLLRRDFTINAMALSLNKPDYGRLVDFYGGLADLKKGLIRVLHKNSFLQDPTRILRAVRFEQRFSFRIEKNTLSLAKQAILRGALGFVTSHRWREELVSLLKEDSPYSYIKRAQKLKAFSFISGKFNLSSSDFKLILRIEEAILRYQNKFKKRRKLEGWIIYLAALLVKLSPSDIHDFLERFGFKKGERIRIISIQQNITRIKRLNKKLKPHNIYRLLNPLSFESIVFFYAYYYTEKRLRKNIELFLDILVDARTKLRGQDLKALGYKPHSLYGKVLEKLLYAKIDKGLIAKQDEIKEASLIFRKLS